jgi:N-methylhydantoinase A
VQPTVTDANLLLGRLQATMFLGGEFTLDLARTRSITTEWLKKQGSQLSLEKFAAGVVQVVNATMEKAIRVVSIERGRDPRQFALVAFGGAGGLHACALAEALSIPTVILPAFPGALSALGILWSDVVKDYSRTVLWRVSGNIPEKKLGAEFDAMETTAKRDFSGENWNGVPRLIRTADLRYSGQGYELNLPLTKTLLRDFEREHRRRYGYVHEKREIELVTLRLRAVLQPAGSSAVLGVRQRLGSRHDGIAAPVWFDGKKMSAKIYSREGLQQTTYRGPAVITEYSATTVMPPGARFKVDRVGNLIITM